MRHWTILLHDPEEVAAVSERVRGAGIETEDGAGGEFTVRDLWGIAVRFSTPEVLAA